LSPPSSTRATVSTHSARPSSPGCTARFKINRDKTNPLKKGESCNLVVDVGTKLGFSLYGIGGSYVVEKNQKLVIALL
jgi:hypothetical protein